MGHIHPSHRDDATWHQVLIGFPDYTAAQDVAATHLASILDTAEGDGLVTSWFFTRKNPFWRLRFATDPDDRDGVEFLRLRLQALTEAGHLASATETIYEPEVHAFGGPDGMTVAHRLFHADSRHVLAHLRTGQAAIGGRELSILLCSTLLRGAGQDWYEQGDVWAHVTEHQAPLPAGTPPDRLHHLRAQLRRLMTTDTSPGSQLLADTEPPAAPAAWVAAFADAGRALRDLAAGGALRRGLRAVLAHHVLFHWNRLGLDPHTKTLLAHAATDAVFTDDAPGRHTHATTAASPQGRGQPMSVNPDQQTMPTTAPRRLAAWFPLVPRGRPAARALSVRIDEIHRLATLPPDIAGPDRLTGVVQALNKAALVASDCGLPGLARELCWRQFTALHAAAPLPATIAQYALEPLVNLGRLATRCGDGITAYRIYRDAFHAVTTGTATRIDGHDVDFANLVQQPEDRQHLRRFLWAILLADGTRALTTTSRWDDVLPHLQRYNGIGDRMLDGRQAAILAHALHGHTEQALAMLDVTTTPQPWEHAVTTCLRTLCQHLAGRAHDAATTDMIDAFRAMSPKPESVVFHTRLGLCTAELAQPTHPTAAKEITTALVQLAVQAGDAHAAGLLAHHGRRPHPAADEQALTRVIEASGTRQCAVPQALLNSLAAATRHSLTTLTDLLTSVCGPDQPHHRTTN